MVNAARRSLYLSLNSLYAHTPFPLPKMALEKGTSPDYMDKKDETINNPGNDLHNVDLESNPKKARGFRNMAIGPRIAPVLPHLKGQDFGSDDSGSDILGKQIEMEANNAIQYRTCSWQKVCPCAVRKWSTFVGSCRCASPSLPGQTQNTTPISHLTLCTTLLFTWHDCFATDFIGLTLFLSMSTQT